MSAVPAARPGFGVAGRPVSHSLSPALHRAAADALGLEDFSYDRFDLGEDELGDFISDTPQLRGLSATMPLKKRLVELAGSCGWEADAAVLATGAANTLLLGPAPRVRNTDVAGIVAALAETGAPPAPEVDVLGAGATAASALVAAADAGAIHANLFVRTRTRAGAARAVAEAVGLTTTVCDLPDWVPGERPLTLSTLPSGALGPGGVDHPLPSRLEGVIFDAGYAPESRPWQESLRSRGAAVVDGSRMLLHQAVEQHVEFAHLAGLDRARAEAARPTVLAAMDAVLRSR